MCTIYNVINAMCINSRIQRKMYNSYMIFCTRKKWVINMTCKTDRLSIILNIRRKTRRRVVQVTSIRAIVYPGEEFLERFIRWRSRVCLVARWVLLTLNARPFVHLRSHILYSANSQVSPFRSIRCSFYLNLN